MTVYLLFGWEGYVWMAGMAVCALAVVIYLAVKK